nr:hypothetical protein BaRGS_005490 [Batillaria attramentaria]
MDESERQLFVLFPLQPRMAQLSSQAGDEVLFQSVRDKRVIILNRPKALNTLNLSMEWESDPNVSMVLIKAAGEKAFCAGADIRAIAEAGKKGDDLARDFFKEEYMLNYKIVIYGSLSYESY